MSLRKNQKENSDARLPEIQKDDYPDYHTNPILAWCDSFDHFGTHQYRRRSKRTLWWWGNGVWRPNVDSTWSNHNADILRIAYRNLLDKRHAYRS
jgi:hypothetical protein